MPRFMLNHEVLKPAGYGERLANEAVSDSQAFMLIHSGHSIRKRPSWHLHVFVLQHRWQKAWVYLFLGVKNTALVMYYATHKAFGLLSQMHHRSLKWPSKTKRLLIPFGFTYLAITPPQVPAPVNLRSLHADGCCRGVSIDLGHMTHEN